MPNPRRSRVSQNAFHLFHGNPIYIRRIESSSAISVSIMCIALLSEEDNVLALDMDSIPEAQIWRLIATLLRKYVFQYRRPYTRHV